MATAAVVTTASVAARSSASASTSCETLSRPVLTGLDEPRVSVNHAGAGAGATAAGAAGTRRRADTMAGRLRRRVDGASAVRVLGRRWGYLPTGLRVRGRHNLGCGRVARRDEEGRSNGSLHIDNPASGRCVPFGRSINRASDRAGRASNLVGFSGPPLVSPGAMSGAGRSLDWGRGNSVGSGIGGSGAGARGQAARERSAWAWVPRGRGG